jgi:hypothetical protein
MEIAWRPHGRERRKAAMRAIRRAEWLPQLKSQIKLSPHPMLDGYH